MPLEPAALLSASLRDRQPILRGREVAFQEMYHTVPVAEEDHTVHHCRYARDPTDSVEPPCLGELGE